MEIRGLFSPDRSVTDSVGFYSKESTFSRQESGICRDKT